MLYPIHAYTPEHQSHVVWSGGFTFSELQQIADVGELAEFQKGSIGGEQRGHGDVRLAVRDTDVSWIMPNNDTEWLYQRMSSIMSKVNHNFFQYDLHGFTSFQYGKYSAGGHYNWHIDVGPSAPERKITMVLALSNQDDYEGGELCLNTNGNADNPVSIKINQGDIIIFPSYTPHIVTPVTAGTRITMVAWACGPRLR